jgi:uncharacterized integral membrane protein
LFDGLAGAVTLPRYAAPASAWRRIMEDNQSSTPNKYSIAEFRKKQNHLPLEKHVKKFRQLLNSFHRVLKKIGYLWIVSFGILLLALLAVFIHTAIADEEFRLYVFYPLVDALIVFVVGLAFVRFVHFIKNKAKNESDKDFE